MIEAPAPGPSHALTKAASLTRQREIFALRHDRTRTRSCRGLPASVWQDFRRTRESPGPHGPAHHSRLSATQRGIPGDPADPEQLRGLPGPRLLFHGASRGQTQRSSNRGRNGTTGPGRSGFAASRFTSIRAPSMESSYTSRPVFIMSRPRRKLQEVADRSLHGPGPRVAIQDAFAFGHVRSFPTADAEGRPLGFR